MMVELLDEVEPIGKRKAGSNRLNLSAKLLKYTMYAQLKLQHADQLAPLYEHHPVHGQGFTTRKCAGVIGSCCSSITEMR
jgi:hypothetical protein